MDARKTATLMGKQRTRIWCSECEQLIPTSRMKFDTHVKGCSPTGTVRYCRRSGQFYNGEEVAKTFKFDDCSCDGVGVCEKHINPQFFEDVLNVKEIDDAIRWCKDCGAVVVDQDIDGRTRPGGVAIMRFPKETSQNENFCN